jgi:hypothetical protein
MDVLELRKEAQEKMGFTDAQADAFVEGFVKEASMFDYETRTGGDKSPGGTLGQDVVKGIGDSFGKSIGGGIGNLAVNSVVSGIASLVGSAKDSLLYRKFTESLKTVVESNRIVRNADRNKVMSYAETIFKFAPHVASDVNLLSQLLANAIHGEGVDPNTIETITRLEERYGPGRNSFQPKHLT